MVRRIELQDAWQSCLPAGLTGGSVEMHMYSFFCVYLLDSSVKEHFLGGAFSMSLMKRSGVQRSACACLQGVVGVLPACSNGKSMIVQT
jgi:hypothetical protein